MLQCRKRQHKNNDSVVSLSEKGHTVVESNRNADRRVACAMFTIIFREKHFLFIYGIVRKKSEYKCLRVSFVHTS